MRKIINIKTATGVSNFIAKIGKYGFSILTNHIVGKNEDSHYFQQNDYLNPGTYLISDIQPVTYHYTAIKHELYEGLWYIDTDRLFIRKIK